MRLFTQRLPICAGRIRRAALLPLLLLLPALHAASWPQWRGPNRDGKSADTGLLRSWERVKPRLLWKFSGLGAGFSSPAVTDDTVYITGKTGDNLVLHALNLRNGRQKWSRVHGPGWRRSYPGSRATPTVAHGAIYLLSGPGLLVCYRQRDGVPVWKRSLKEFGGKPGPWGFAESVLVSGNYVFATPGGPKGMVALDRRTGRTVWTSQANRGPAHYCSPIMVMVNRMPVLIQGNGGGLFGLDARNGKVLFTDPFAARNTANCPTPAYSNGYVFWAVGYGKGGVCLRLGVRGTKISAKRAWTTKNMVCHHGGYVIHRGHIYGNNGRGWACLDLRTGGVRWKARGVGKGSICFADGMLYTYGEKGGVCALVEATPDGYVERGRIQVAGRGPSWAHPVVAQGCLFLRYGDNLYCFDVRARE